MVMPRRFWPPLSLNSMRWAWAFLWLGMAGCSGDPAPTPGQARANICVSDSPPADGNEAVLIGKSDGDVFKPLSASDSLTVFHGPQGGQHFFASLKLFTQKLNRWEHLIDVIDNASQAPAGGTRIAVISCDAQWLVTHDIPVFLDYDSITDGLIRVQSKPAASLGLDIQLNAETEAHFVSE